MRAAAATMAAPGGMWAIEVTTPSDNGILRQAGSPLPSALPAALKNYATSLAVRGAYIELRISPVLRNIAHREYVYTYVNQYGEESAPSEAAGIEVPEDGAVRLVLKGHANDKGYCPVSRIRLYRAETGTNTTSWLYHSEYANAETVVIEDTLPGSALGAPIQTVGFYPPDEGLETLAVMANGMMVTSRGNQVYISEQYLPYAWSPENTQVTQGRVVGLCAAEGGMYVTTTSVFSIRPIAGCLHPVKSDFSASGRIAAQHLQRRRICRLGIARWLGDGARRQCEP